MGKKYKINCILKGEISTYWVSSEDGVCSSRTWGIYLQVHNALKPWKTSSSYSNISVILSKHYLHSSPSCHKHCFHTWVHFFPFFRVSSLTWPFHPTSPVAVYSISQLTNQTIILKSLQRVVQIFTLNHIWCKPLLQPLQSKHEWHHLTYICLPISPIMRRAKMCCASLQGFCTSLRNCSTIERASCFEDTVSAATHFAKEWNACRQNKLVSYKNNQKDHSRPALSHFFTTAHACKMSVHSTSECTVARKRLE